MTLNFLVLLFTGGAVFFMSVLVIGVLRQAYSRYEEKYLAKHITDLSEMFFFVGPQQLIILTVAITTISAAIGLMLLGPVLTVIICIAGMMTPTLLVRFYRARRVRMFERQLVDALGAMASAFRAGMTFYQALDEIAKTSRPPLSQEFALTVREMRIGVNPEEALENLAGRVASDDLHLVVVSTNTARSVGGNMAEMFDTVSQTIRDRFRIEGRIRSLTAQGRLQGIIMGLMPVLVWLAFDSLRPDLTRPMMDHWFGYLIVGCVLFMELLGGLFIRKIINIKV